MAEAVSIGFGIQKTSNIKLFNIELNYKQKKRKVKERFVNIP